MPEGRRCSIYLTDDEWAIADSTAKRMGISRSEVIRHLLLYQGMCGGSFPLTAKIIALPPADRDRLIAEIRRRAEAGDPIKPQSFREWVKEVLGTADPETVDRGTDALIKKLLG